MRGEASTPGAWRQVAGMVVRPRETLTVACAAPASLPTALLVLGIATAADLSYLATDVGRLAALDQQVRQLE
jgi:hypothetical protein